MASPQKNDSNAVFEEDNGADVFAAVAIITIVIAAVCFWLHGMA